MDLDLTQIKQVLESGAGEHLKKYLAFKLNELKDIENVKDIENADDQALEVKSQKRAYDKLKEILLEIVVFDDKPKVKDPRDSLDVR